jgi:hypothetical protein
LNRQWHDFTGLDFEPGTGGDWTQCIHPDDREENARTWRHAIATAPHLLSKTMLVSETDHDKFIHQVASRMGVDPTADIRPALLVHTSLATVKFILDRWLTTNTVANPPFNAQLDDALRTTLAGFG